jgi:hypothetical protein
MKQSRIRYERGKMALIVGGGDVPDSFRDFVNNSGDPELREALKGASHPFSSKGAEGESPEEDPLCVSNSMSSFRITRGGRFKTAEVREYNFSHLHLGEEQVNSRKEDALHFEDFVRTICTGCGREPGDDGETHCNCKKHWKESREHALREKAALEARGEKLSSWHQRDLEEEEPVVKMVTYTKVLDSEVYDRGPWLQKNLSTEITL